MDLIVLECEGLDRIQLAEDREQWQAFLNMVINIHVLQEAGYFFDQLSNCQFLKQNSASWS
jgi:hypothetical protein